MPAVPTPPWVSGAWSTTAWAGGAWGWGPILFLPISVRIDYYDGVGWVDITGDTVALDELRIDYGIRGAGPLDMMASTGTCAWTLSSRSPVGKYAPAHASVATGWGIDTPIRVTFVAADLTEVVKFRGTVSLIDPVPGVYGRKTVAVVAHDYIAKLANARVTEIDAQIDQTDKALIEAVYAALPADFQPPATLIDDAIDTYRYAFDEVGPGDQAMGLLQDVLTSASGLLFQRGDGTHVYRNRLSRTYTESVDEFTDDDMVDLRVISDRADVYDGVVIEVPQIEIGESVEVLASETGDDRDPIPAGATVERWMEYRDPLYTATAPVRVAGTAMVQPVATTDYTFNSQVDGLGTNMTASVTVTADYFSGTCKLTIDNAAGVPAFRILLRVRGTAIRRFQPRVVTSGNATGTKVLQIQSPYQGSTSVAQFQADVYLGQYGTAINRPTEVAIVAQRSERLMAHAIQREPGDRITLVEAVTGLSADAIIHGVYLSVKAPCWIEECRWFLAPQSSYLFLEPWRWGVVGASEWGETTVFA